MEERTLLKLALICAIIGIFSLLLVSRIAKLEETPPGMVGQHIDDTLLVSGTVEKVRSAGNMTFIEISSKDRLTIVLFEEPLYKLREGQELEAIGTIETYKGSYEMLAEEIRVR